MLLNASASTSPFLGILFVHDQSYTRVCTGCAADKKAAS